MTIKIKEESLLHYLSTMSGVRTSFLVEVDSDTAPFTKTAERLYEARLANTGSSVAGVTIRTMVNGKVTAADYFPIHRISEENNNKET